MVFNNKNTNPKDILQLVEAESTLWHKTHVAKYKGLSS